MKSNLLILIYAGIIIMAGTLETQGATAQGGPEVTKDQKSITISANGKTILKYRYAEVAYKPYIEELCSPSGIQIIRDSPSDHLHHHGLMLAITVDGVNYWEEAKTPGRQALESMSEITTGKDNPNGWVAASFTSKLKWLPFNSEQAGLLEERSIETYSAISQKASLVTWQSRFTLPEGKESATLSGTLYHGLGMRFLASMDKGGSFLNADGKSGVEGTNNARSPWCAYSALADGKPVTVASFDHPANTRFPATWFTMDQGFAYISNTLNLNREPLTLKKPDAMLLRYGIAVWDGPADAEGIAKLYKEWTAMPEIKKAQ